MHAQPVDPRDIEWEVDRPAYRVYFWQQIDGLQDAGWASEEWQLDGSDVHEVLAWAEKDQAHRAYTLYVCCTREGRPGLIRLCGTDPTTGD